MYTVTYGSTLIYHPLSDDVQIVDAVVEHEENKAGSFSFTMPANHLEYNKIQRRAEVVEVKLNEEIIFRGRVISIEQDFWKNKKVKCEGEMSYLNDSIQRQAQFIDEPIRNVLMALLKSHNEQVEESKRISIGSITMPAPEVNLTTNMTTTMQALSDIRNGRGGIFRIRYEGTDRFLDYLKEDDGRTSNQPVRLEENLIDFNSNLDSAEIATAIIPLGIKLEESVIPDMETRLNIKSVNEGKDYIYSQDAVNSFGWIYKTITFDEIDNPSDLKAKAQTYLNSVQFENMTIDCKVVDLNLIDVNYQGFRLMDKIRVVASPYGLDKYFRLTKRSFHLDAPEQDTITLGKQELVSMTARSAELAQNLRSMVESITPKNNILSLAKQNATELINGNGQNGYVVLHNNAEGVPYEILLMDTPNIETAQKVWRWNQNGLGYSSTGYTGEYGLAMTIDGAIVADFITSGTMMANRIRGGEFIVGGTGTGQDGSIIGYNASQTQTLFKLDKNGATFNGILEANALTGGVGKQLNDAIATANNAIATANSAIEQVSSVANSAQSTANTANYAASVAQTAASTANSAASTANSVAQSTKTYVENFTTGRATASTIRGNYIYANTQLWCGDHKLTFWADGTVHWT